jgi:hypothetical protein
VIRHVAVFTFAPEFGREEREHWMGLLRALEGQVAGLRSMTVGVDMLHGPASAELAIVADFDDLDALARYTRHPLHEEILRISGPVKRSLATVDFELGSLE